MRLASREAPSTYTGGILLMCVGVACLSVNDAVAKTLTTSYAPLQILFMRNVIALPFTVLLAFLLGEHVGWRRWLAVLLGFVGVLFIVRPGGATFQPISLLPVATALV